MMHAAQAALLENLVGPCGEGAIGKIELLNGIAQ